MTRHQKRFIPILISLGVVLGIIIGSFFTSHFSGRRLSIINSSSNKVNDLFRLIDDEYVDSVNIPDLVEKSLPEILKQLDPHSIYISPKDAELSMQDLNGGFSGIGIQFYIYQDTLRVIKVIKGGPSENIGLKAGDKIIKIDNKPFVGKTIKEEDARNKLKGKKDTKVTLTILRGSPSKQLNFTIIRGNVPLRSVVSNYKLNNNIGYIKIKNFGENTYSEFLADMAQLGTKDLKCLIIDLRGNTGGYVEPAIQIVQEFLPKGKLIVYTEGRKTPRENYYSDGRGAFQTLPLIVLIDENTASASEILSGALQDNDRALIIGRRSFGKGLVQIPIQFRDGSILRLTKARYYTPSGRCVQKPYKSGDDINYNEDLLLRERNGEYYNSDSIKHSGQKYHTSKGRIVYGGGGIIPDIFVPLDTIGMTSYFKEAYLRGLIFKYSFVVMENYRNELENVTALPDIIKFLDTKKVVEQFPPFAEKEGLKRRNILFKKSYLLFKQYIYSNIIDDLYGEDKATEYLNLKDNYLQKALEHPNGLDKEYLQ